MHLTYEVEIEGARVIKELPFVMGVLGNFSGETVRADMPGAAAWARAELLLSNAPPPDEDALFTLRPWEARVYKRRAEAPAG